MRTSVGAMPFGLRRAVERENDEEGFAAEGSDENVDADANSLDDTAKGTAGDVAAQVAGEDVADKEIGDVRPEMRGGDGVAPVLVHLDCVTRRRYVLEVCRSLFSAKLAMFAFKHSNAAATDSSRTCNITQSIDTTRSTTHRKLLSENYYHTPCIGTI